MSNISSESSTSRWFNAAFFALTAFLVAGRCLAAVDRSMECGALFNSVGPYDYRDPSPQREWERQDTKRNHYDVELYRIRQGELSRNVMGGIDFLLRNWPNHYPALELLIEYEMLGGKPYDFRSTDCYFERARRFAPDDVKVVLLEGWYFLKVGNHVRARASYEAALDMNPESADVNYNVGLFYTKIGEFELARERARIAYRLGYPLQGLRTVLESRGFPIEDDSAIPDSMPPAEMTRRE